MNKKKGLFGRFVQYYKPHALLFTVDMLCALVIAGCNLVYPMLTRTIINEYVPDKLLYSMLIALGALLAIYIVKAALNYVLQYWGHLVGVRMQADMRSELFLKLEHLPFAFFDDHKTGAIMSRLTNDLFDISELAHHAPEDLFLSAVTIIGSFIMLMFINVPLTLIVFAAIPLVLVFFTLTRKKMKDSFREMRERTADVNANIESAISGVRVARAYNAIEHEVEKFEVENVKFVKARSKAYKVMGEFFSSMTFFLDLLYFIVLLAGGLFFYYDRITSADFFTYILYITTLITPIRTLTNIYEQIQSGMTGFKRFAEIMDQPAEPEAADAVRAGRLSGHIRFDNVSFSYKNDEKENFVIKNFNMEIPAGRTVALVGPSGGGKTTLCHLIPRFYEIDCGSITIDGTDIRKFSRYSLRENIAIVQQDMFLFNGSIRENIAYGNFNAGEDEIIAAAKRANIHDFICGLPDGYDTNVGERGVKLSGGQKQRVSIARAFLKNPPVLILDEATSALDNATEMLIQESLKKLSSGRTTLVVAHRLSTIKNADKILVVTSEGIKEQGTHEELMSKKGIYKTLYDYQFKALA